MGLGLRRYRTRRQIPIPRGDRFSPPDRDLGQGKDPDFLPQIGIFPLAELATGDGARGLGNGRTWYQLPVWAQKSWGPWTTYGGGGVVLNPAPSQRDHGFAGWLVQRDIGQHLTLGTELFWQGAETAGGRGSVIANAGGY